MEQGSRESSSWGKLTCGLIRAHSEPDAGSGSSHYRPTWLLGEGKAFQSLGAGCSQPTASQAPASRRGQCHPRREQAAGGSACLLNSFIVHPSRGRRNAQSCLRGSSSAREAVPGGRARLFWTESQKQIEP